MNSVKMILVLICQVVTAVAFGQITQIGAKEKLLRYACQWVITRQPILFSLMPLKAWTEAAGMS